RRRRQARGQASVKSTELGKRLRTVGSSEQGTWSREREVDRDQRPRPTDPADRLWEVGERGSRRSAPCRPAGPGHGQRNPDGWVPMRKSKLPGVRPARETPGAPPGARAATRPAGRSGQGDPDDPAGSLPIENLSPSGTHIV